MIKAISKDEIIRRGAIFIEQVQDGFKQYEVEYMEGSEDEILQELLKYYHCNGTMNSYVDFYYYRLTESEKKIVDSCLLDDEQTYLSELEESSDHVIYPLNEILLRITAKLTAKEILFSTFYFTKEPRTIWGNYGCRYPMFLQKP